MKNYSPPIDRSTFNNLKKEIGGITPASESDPKKLTEHWGVEVTQKELNYYASGEAAAKERATKRAKYEWNNFLNAETVAEIAAMKPSLGSPALKTYTSKETPQYSYGDWYQEQFEFSWSTITFEEWRDMNETYQRYKHTLPRFSQDSWYMAWDNFTEQVYKHKHQINSPAGKPARYDITTVVATAALLLAGLALIAL